MTINMGKKTTETKIFLWSICWTLLIVRDSLGRGGRLRRQNLLVHSSHVVDRVAHREQISLLRSQSYELLLHLLQLGFLRVFVSVRWTQVSGEQNQQETFVKYEWLTESMRRLTFNASTFFNASSDGNSTSNRTIKSPLSWVRIFIIPCPLTQRNVSKTQRKSKDRKKFPWMSLFRDDLFVSDLERLDHLADVSAQLFVHQDVLLPNQNHTKTQLNWFYASLLDYLHYAQRAHVVLVVEQR